MIQFFMKWRGCFILGCFFIGPYHALAMNMDLSVKNFEIVSFDGIKETKYTNEGAYLLAQVDHSSSMLMKAFDKIETISSVSIEWQSEGSLKVKDYGHEQTKKGDDAFLRIALILSGKAPFLPFFAPSWIKKISTILKLPSDRMLYLTLGSKAKPGATWKSPYSDSIESIALESEMLEDSWYRSKIKFSDAKKVVGYWIFSDGDDTKSRFTTKIRSLKFDP